MNEYEGVKNVFKGSKDRLHVTLNGDMLCAIDTETTGLNPEEHDIVELGVIALDSDYNPIQSIMPFHIVMKPKFPERADEGALKKNGRTLAKLILDGADPWMAVDSFIAWFDGLKLKPGKKIAPLGFNFMFDSLFLRNWMGRSTYEHMFSGHFRDSMLAAILANDLADLHQVVWPYPKKDLGSIAGRLNIEHWKSHTALEDALVTAKVYKRMMYEFGRICTHRPAALAEDKPAATEESIAVMNAQVAAEAKAVKLEADIKLAVAEVRAEARAAKGKSPSDVAKSDEAVPPAPAVQQDGTAPSNEG